MPKKSTSIVYEGPGMWPAEPEKPKAAVQGPAAVSKLQTNPTQQTDGPSPEFEKQQQPSAWEKFNPFAIPKAEAAGPKITGDQLRKLLEFRNDKDQPVFTTDQLFDHVAEVDPDLGQKLNSAVAKGVTRQQALNFFAYGTSVGITPTKEPKALGEGLLFNKPQKSFLQRSADLLQDLYGYAVAPVNVATGGIEAGVNAISGAMGGPQVFKNDPAYRDLRQNIEKTADVAPTFGAMAGSIAGPLGTGLGGGVGKALQMSINGAMGRNGESQDISALPGQAARAAGTAVFDTALDYGVRKAVGGITKGISRLVYGPGDDEVTAALEQLAQPKANRSMIADAAKKGLAQTNRAGEAIATEADDTVKAIAQSLKDNVPGIDPKNPIKSIQSISEAIPRLSEDVQKDIAAHNFAFNDQEIVGLLQKAKEAAIDGAQITTDAEEQTWDRVAVSFLKKFEAETAKDPNRFLGLYKGRVAFDQIAPSSTFGDSVQTAKANAFKTIRNVINDYIASNMEAQGSSYAPQMKSIHYLYRALDNIESKLPNKLADTAAETTRKMLKSLAKRAAISGAGLLGGGYVVHELTK